MAIFRRHLSKVELNYDYVRAQCVSGVELEVVEVPIGGEDEGAKSRGAADSQSDIKLRALV